MNTINTKALKDMINTFKLESADILLIHTKKSIWGWIIRQGTRCYWNHALIVCSPGSSENGYNDTLIIDAKTGGTIEMDYLNKYLNRGDKYDIAVKRFEANWFRNNEQLYKSDFREHICNIAANEVAINYNSKPVELVNQFIRQTTIVLRFLRRKIFRSRESLRLPWNIRPVQMKAFTCSGFIQWSYYRGVSQLTKKHRLDMARTKDVLFNPRAKKKITPYELLTTTPADLANCKNLSWKYIIKDGLIREIPSFQGMFSYSGAI